MTESMGVNVEVKYGFGVSFQVAFHRSDGKGLGWIGGVKEEMGGVPLWGGLAHLAVCDELSAKAVGDGDVTGYLGFGDFGGECQRGDGGEVEIGVLVS